jgi:O-antigen/teichoic acid export membrane protein
MQKGTASLRIQPSLLPSRITRRGQFARRAAWGISDQALSSLSNFLLSVLVARAASPSAFGAFTIAIALYAIFLQFVRGLVGLPISIRLSVASHDRWTIGVHRATGAALSLGALLGLGTLGAGAAIGGQLGLALVLLGAGMPFLMLQDTWRYAFFAVRRGASAFANDSLWTASFVVVILVGHLAFDLSPLWMIAAWGAGAGAGAALGILQTRLVPQLSGSARWLRETRDIGMRFAVETLAVTGTGQGAFFLIGAILGLATLGSVRGAYTLLGPLNILFFGIMIMGVPEAARLARDAPKKLARRAAQVAIGLALFALGVGAVLTALPNSVGVAILGQLWYSSSAYLLPMTIFMSLTGIQIGALIGLRGLAAAKISLRAALIASPVTFAATLAGALLASADGAAWGLCVGRASAAAISWFAFRVASAAHVRPAVPTRSTPESV